MPPFSTPPWDTKAPKENVVAWEQAGLVHGEVLDIGCGLGDNAIYLAQQGFAVTGLDISSTALITAERRAADAGVNVRFAVADATNLDGYTDAFDTVIDSGMFHCLDDEGKRSYSAAVHRAARPGATMLMALFFRRQSARRRVAPAGGVRANAARDAGRRGLGDHLAGAGDGATPARRHRSGVSARASAAPLTTLMQRDRPHPGA